MADITVSIAGASGYAGGELLRLLAHHPNMRVTSVAAGGKVGRRLTSVHPGLTGALDASGSPCGYDDMILESATPAVLDADVVFLALPHGKSADVARALPAEALIIDLGADHRLDDAADWDQYYGGDHAGTWPYGLPELPGAREVLAGSRRIANPGCYPTAVALALAPVLSAGVASPEDIVVVAASGTSGAGRQPSDSLLASEVMSSMSAYKAGGTHQHSPEMSQALGRAAGSEVSLLFTPTLAPMPRGILATCTAHAEPGVGADDVEEVLHAAYGNEPFVHVLPQGQWPRTSSVLGGNSVHVAATFDPVTGRITVVAALDNLIKGAAGQAIQNANIALGLPETSALPVTGVAP